MPCRADYLPEKKPEVEGDWPAKKRSRAHPLGAFHVDNAEDQATESKLYRGFSIEHR